MAPSNNLGLLFDLISLDLLKFKPDATKLSELRELILTF